MNRCTIFCMSGHKNVKLVGKTLRKFNAIFGENTKLKIWAFNSVIAWQIPTKSTQLPWKKNNAGELIKLIYIEVEAPKLLYHAFNINNSIENQTSPNKIFEIFCLYVITYDGSYNWYLCTKIRKIKWFRFCVLGYDILWLLKLLS